ncbi:hypothetical protein ACHWQZ_G010989 [Mnemiopsis leidyi]
MSRKKLKQSKDNHSSILSKCPILKTSLLASKSEDEIIVRLQDALCGNSADVNKLISIFRRLINEISHSSLQLEQYEYVTSVAISVIEHKQLRQIASKLLVALAKTHDEIFNSCLAERKFISSESLMFMLLYCSECVKHLKVSVLKSHWENYFRTQQDLSAIEDNKFIFACRAFNSYIGAIEKYHGNLEEEVVDNKTFSSIIALASNKCFNRDCRQVLGLICLTLKTISTKSHQQSYNQLISQSYNSPDTPDIDLDFYRFSLSAGMVSKVKDFVGVREVLYNQVLNHVINMAQRTDIDKQFTISVFKTISLFLQTVLGMGEEAKMHQYPDQEERSDPLRVDKELLHPDSQLTGRLLALVQVHWSNKLESVRRTVSEIHSTLIKVTTLLAGEETSRIFLKNQVKGLLSLSWTVQGKYQALTQLVPIIGTPAVLQIEPDLPRTILKTLTNQQAVVNHCAGLYFALYKHDETETSQETWLSPITEFLDNPFLCDLCLRPILEFDEGSLYYLRDILNSQNRSDELVRVLREGRRLGFLDVKFTDEPELFTDNQDTLFEIPISKIKVLCDSTDDNKVLSVMSLICDTNKTALPMTRTELDLMTHIIKNNQIRQVPSFRKNLLDNLDKFLSRLNFSCPILSRLVKNRYTEEDEMVSDRASEVLQFYSDFIISCTGECYKQLIPSASFQRQVTVIGILEKFYGNLRNCNAACLFEISSDNLGKLIDSITSPFESVRSSSLSCISYIQNIPKRCLDTNLSKVLASLSSPKGVSSQKNSALFSFILNQSLETSAITPTNASLDDSHHSSLFKRDSSSDQSLLYQWIEGLFATLDYQISKAEEGLMEAARTYPIFPTFNLLDVALKGRDLKVDLTTDEQEVIISKLLEYSQQLCTILHEPIVDESPEGLLLLGSIDSGGGSCGPQLLLSMTWRTMQSVCSCLVTLVSSSITTPQQDLTVGIYLKNLLLTVRHHGVFENVHSAFIAYTAAMWERKKELVLSWLEEVLCRVENSENDMSYTRRSAGIPSLIQAILVTESGRNGKPYFRSSMERLLQLSEHPTLITGRIHALNILHTLFKDSKLAEFVVPYIGRAFEISISGFSERLWSLRNASTMLFSVLVTRLFHNRHSHTRQVTDATFFTLFPNLHPYFMRELDKAVHVERRLYYPSLYPTLLVLQRLTPCPLSSGDPNLSLSHFVDVIQKLTFSGVLKTRSLAAETLSAIISGPEIQSYVEGRVRSLEKGSQQNQLHGTLLQVKHGLAKCQDLTAVSRELVKKCWLLTDNNCPYTAALYVENLSKSITTESRALPELATLTESAMSVLRSSPKIGPMYTLKEACAGLVISLQASDLAREMMFFNQCDLCELVFESPGVEGWLRLSSGGTAGISEWGSGLSAALHVLKTGHADESFKTSIYHHIVSVLQCSRNPRTQTKGLEILSYISNIPSPEDAVRIIGQCSLCFDFILTIAY